MSFEMTALEYDANRKLQSSLLNYNQTATSMSSQYTGVPYNLHFSLYIYIRNIDDGLQIVEQILPIFNPDYSLTLDFIDEMGITRNAPIILDNVQMDTEYEGDAVETERRLVWTLNFTVQTTFYGPTTSAGPITEAIVNFDSYNTAPGTQVTLVTANTPLGGFTTGETVYQGASTSQANAIGTVVSWNPMGGQLVINMVSGGFIANSNVYGTGMGGTVEVLSIPTELIYATVIETPNPNNASNIYADFGFTTQIIEYPQTGQYIPPNPISGGSGQEGGGSGSNSFGSGNYQVDVYNNGILALANAVLNFYNSPTVNVSTIVDGNQIAIYFNTNASNTEPVGAEAYAQANLAYARANLSVINVSAANTQNLVISGNTTNVIIDTLNAGSGGNTFNIVSANSTYSNNFFIGDLVIFTALVGTMYLNGTTYIIDSFPATTYNTVKYLTQISAPGYGGGSFQCGEVICMQDGTNTYMTEYADLVNVSTLGYFTSSLSGGNFQLSFTTYNLASAMAIYKIVRQALAS